MDLDRNERMVDVIEGQEKAAEAVESEGVEVSNL